MKKIMLTFGTRPEAIKMAPLVLAMRQTEKLQPIVCVSGQHRQMLDQVLELFDIRPDLDLAIMRDGQDLTDINANVLFGMREAFKTFEPNMLLIHGDTSTAMAASVAAFYAGIPTGHVEAGLRSHNMSSPYPEEFNRRVVSLTAAAHFAPTPLARNQLLAEGIPDARITVTGNTIIDSLHFILHRLENNEERRQKIDTMLSNCLHFDHYHEKFIVITGHRRESFGAGFKNMCTAIKFLAEKYPHIHFVYPVHLNPNVKQPVYQYLSNRENIHLINPLEYESFLWLLRHCHFALTDSGGIQEEGPSLAKPVLVMREITERPEGVDAGAVSLVGANFDKIVSETSRLLTDSEAYNTMSQAVNPYGDGRACERIIHFLTKELP